MPALPFYAVSPRCGGRDGQTTRSRLPHVVWLRAHQHLQFILAHNNNGQDTRGLGAADISSLNIDWFLISVTQTRLTVSKTECRHCCPFCTMSSSKASAQSIAKASPTDHCGKSVRSAEGLQIAEPETYPEAVNRYTPTRDTKLPQLQDHSSPDEEASICTRPSHEHISFRLGPGSDRSGCGTTLEVPPDLVKKFFDHRRRRFLFIIVFTLFILGAAIAASIGGSLYVQDRAQKYVNLLCSLSFFCPPNL